MTEWFAMGGYARFVWPAYLLTAGILVWNLWAPRRSYRKLRKALQAAPARSTNGETERET